MPVYSAVVCAAEDGDSAQIPHRIMLRSPDAGAALAALTVRVGERTATSGRRDAL